MNTIVCSDCGKEIAIDKALEGQIEARVLAIERHKHQEELNEVLRAQAQVVKKATEQAASVAQAQLAAEKELVNRQAEADIALEKQKLEQQLKNDLRRSSQEQVALVEALQQDAVSAKEDNKKLRQELSQLLEQLRQATKEKDNAALEAKRTLAKEEQNIREEATKSALETQRLTLAEKDKQIEAAKRQVEEMQRKLNQGSQQMQGEILELDIEQSLAVTFKDDRIEPVAKGVNGADIRQYVRSQSGTECGVILWELKRTKNWTEGWIAKLKEDLRSEKANIPVIVTSVMPKTIQGDIGLHVGVWVCKPALTTVLATLLRKGLLDVARQKMVAERQETSAEALYSFVTSHEFSQQIENMLETYQAMSQQITKERVAYEKLWAQREKQASSLLMSTANIIGSMHGHIGAGSMPKIKGLELDLLGSGSEL